MDDLVARRRMLREAAAGIDALNTWIKDVFERADAAEGAGDDQLAEEMRSGVTSLWTELNSSSSIIACELHDAMSPSHAPFADAIPV